MQPEMWKPPVELSVQEEQIVKKIRKAKLFVFLRRHRHELFDEAQRARIGESLPGSGARTTPDCPGDARAGAHPASLYGHFR
jgi:hypothetical protein